MAELRLGIQVVNQGCQALFALLDHDVGAAQRACHLLTLSELASFAVADGLAMIARGVSREVRPSYAHDKAVSDTRSYPSEPR